MKNLKESFVFGFAIFAAFFGAGNLILPPMLGLKSGTDWWLVAIGFIVSATLIPLLALLAHAKLQGTMMDFGKKVSTPFSLGFCVAVYFIAVVLPCPRTAAVTHEIAIAPLFGSDPWITSTIYFLLVFLFAINRSKVLQILGKYLTPFIGILLFAIILIGLFGETSYSGQTAFNSPLISGFFEGYQTYDAIAGLLTGGIVVISLNLEGQSDRAIRKRIIAGSSLIAMFGLLIIYAGLIALGATKAGTFESDITRTELLSGLSMLTLGRMGSVALSVLVSLACFTTAVGIVVGTADYFKGLFNQSKTAYVLSLALSCLIGIAMGQFNVSFIIDVAIPALMFIYPLAIVLILLNNLSDRWATPVVFRWVVAVTFLFSIPDVLIYFYNGEGLQSIRNTIPLANENLGWVIPALLVFFILNLRNARRS